MKVGENCLILYFTGWCPDSARKKIKDKPWLAHEFVCRNKFWFSPVNALFQTLMTMIHTYTRATRNEDLSNEMKNFAKDFKKKADEKMMEEE